jgi:hypothetical protein
VYAEVVPWARRWCSGCRQFTRPHRRTCAKIPPPPLLTHPGSGSTFACRYYGLNSNLTLSVAQFLKPTSNDLFTLNLMAVPAEMLESGSTLSLEVLLYPASLPTHLLPQRRDTHVCGGGGETAEARGAFSLPRTHRTTGDPW